MAFPPNTLPTSAKLLQLTIDGITRERLVNEIIIEGDIFK